MSTFKPTLDASGDTIREGDTIHWCNGPLGFTEIVYRTLRGDLAVRGLLGRAMPISTIKATPTIIQRQKIQPTP